jgi:hypothetical protein
MVEVERIACGESKWSLKDNRMNSDKKQCATADGGVPDVEWMVGMGTATGDGYALNGIEGSKTRPRSTN